MFKKFQNKLAEKIVAEIKNSVTITTGDLKATSLDTAALVRKDIDEAVSNIRQSVYTTAQTTRKLFKKQLSSTTSTTPDEESKEIETPQENIDETVNIKPNTFGLEELAFANFFYNFVEDGNLYKTKDIVNLNSQQFVEDFKIYIAKHNYYPGLTPRSFNCVLLKVLRNFEISPSTTLRNETVVIDGENLEKFVNKWRTIKKKAWGI